MSFLYSLTIKKKLILSYLSLVIVSIVLSWNSISNCLTNKDVAGFVPTTLSERYVRTRTTADYAFAVNTIIQSINNGASYDSAKASLNDNVSKMQVEKEKVCSQINLSVVVQVLVLIFAKRFMDTELLILSPNFK